MNTPITEPVIKEVARAIELSGGPAVVARALNVSTQTVCFYRDGQRRIKSDYGAVLELLSNSQVTRRDIWPVSWPRIWPELADPAPAAHHPNPAPPAEQGVANA